MSKFYGFISARHLIEKKLMEINNILGASLIDIIFEGRNKNYGAYELRKKYNSRLYSAIIGTIAFTALVVFASFISSGFDNKMIIEKFDIPDVTIGEVDPPAVTPPPPPPPPVQQQPRIATSIFTNPLIVNQEIEPDEAMKDQDVLAETKIGTFNADGDKFSDIVAPPIDEPKTGVITGPTVDDGDKTYIDVQIQAKFPGGDEAWRKYISREIERYMDELQEEGKAGSCTVQFVVDKDGTISEVEALTMKGSKLAEIAVNAIRKGPKWSPAENNGKKVKAYRKQPVTFQLLQ